MGQICCLSFILLYFYLFQSPGHLIIIFSPVNIVTSWSSSPFSHHDFFINSFLLPNFDRFKPFLVFWCVSSSTLLGFVLFMFVQVWLCIVLIRRLFISVSFLEISLVSLFRNKYPRVVKFIVIWRVNFVTFDLNSLRYNKFTTLFTWQLVLKI